MRTLVHLSDVHFGRADGAVAAAVIATVQRLQPDLVAVSGDLTQRARTAQFQEARAFLDALPHPQIVVPGNHDVPLRNIYDRFLHALDKYKAYITTDLEPFYEDEEIAVLGINTARSLTIKGGEIDPEQMVRVEQKLGSARGPVKILITHHPFDLPEIFRGNALVDGAEQAMSRFAQVGVDLLLAGHIHLSYSGPTALRYAAGGYSSIFVQAGTACSTRERGEPNSFNVLRIERDRIQLDVLSTEATGSLFQISSTKEFQRTEAGWQLTPNT